MTPTDSPFVPRTPADTLKFERRRARREAADGVAIATYRGADGRAGITQMRVRDRSAGGLGVVSASRLDVGCVVSLAPADGPGPWLSAVAVACREDGGAEGWRVGLRLSQSAIAA